MKSFTPDQIKELLSVIRMNFISFNKIVLLKEDIELLSKFSIDVNKFCEAPINDDFAFKFSRLSLALRKDEIETMSFNDFKRFVADGKMMPYTEEEEDRIKYLKQKTYSHIKYFEPKIGSSFQKQLNNETSHKAQFEKLIHDELLQGALNRKSLQNIVSDLGHKTGVWIWHFIVPKEMHNAYEYGRASQIKRFAKNKNVKNTDPLVYKLVFPQACEHCIRLFLTNGIGSPPKIFKLSELVSNGYNTGLKEKDWKPTLYSIHSDCRCSIQALPEYYKYNTETRRYKEDLSKWKPKIYSTSKVKITIGDKSYFIDSAGHKCDKE